MIIFFFFFFTTRKYNFLSYLKGCNILQSSGPSCSKLTTLLVYDLLKFTSSDRQIC